MSRRCLLYVKFPTSTEEIAFKIGAIKGLTVRAFDNVNPMHKFSRFFSCLVLCLRYNSDSMSDPPACDTPLSSHSHGVKLHPFVVVPVSPHTLLIIRLLRSCVLQDKIEIAHVRLCALKLYYYKTSYQSAHFFIDVSAWI